VLCRVVSRVVRTLGLFSGSHRSIVDWKSASGGPILRRRRGLLLPVSSRVPASECEALLGKVTSGSGLEVYVLRSCIVGGPKATAPADSMAWRQISERLPASLRGTAGVIQGMLPLMPDAGVAMQFVHHDDVATAIALAAGAGEPGAYNLAADGGVSLREVAEATGTRAIRVPHALAAALDVVARLPMLPAAAGRIHVGRGSVVMDTSRAKDVLGCCPQYTSRETLAALAEIL
jgi:UDP-glucose 4-epimerase